MPRKPPTLSTTDLKTIIKGECGKVPALIEWANGELDRREAAGKAGGRPKKEQSDREIVPIEDVQGA